ncbi:ABC transporter substrate-binding protein [Bradyrhizobium canariense]|uniref:4,5-dihydroxyphthalate decarboxylase n=1 Tax=Bradyrhizobium canariense TaxID=255045 RepID=A0A1H2AJG5_9BRAD|nr:ABC transporter substrate-binding protein [Bradyrhizobium canariense]SDT46103.1 4,5-dihydroxyphthalate decarboxylase [Bradyrhizobium canariense]
MTLILACGNYDRTRRLIDGEIGIEGHGLDVQTLPPETMFARAFNDLAFDISELSFSTYLMHVARGTCGYAGIPVFPSRAFRHSAIYVRADGGVETPEDLSGRVVGVRNYLNTAALVVRGLLSDVYGVAASDISWRIGDVDDVERDTIAVPDVLGDTDIRAVPRGATLSSMLVAGEIDAIVHYHPPHGFGPAPAPIKRLFADSSAAEQRYFADTGVFPIMHLVGVRRTLLRDQPSLASKVYDAFERARNVSENPREQETACDRWANGVARNRAALEMLSRYAFEQGITERQLRLDELFVPDLMQT